MLAVACAGLLASGCTNTVQVGRNRTVAVSLTEYRVRPDSIAATAGSVTFLVRNDGLLTHNLTVTRGSRTIAATAPIPPGGSARLTVDLSRGTYTVASAIQSDQALGEHGTLQVRGR